MSTIIKIIRDSIKKNPNAGNTTTVFVGAANCRFSFEGEGRIPDDLYDKVVITQWENSVDPKFGIHQTGVLLNPDDYSTFLNIPGILVIRELNNKRINHLPEPEYFFEYENTSVECSKCHHMVPVNDIIPHAFVTEDDEYELDQCPHCNETNSFDYEYESITDALKEKEGL